MPPPTSARCSREWSWPGASGAPGSAEPAAAGVVVGAGAGRSEVAGATDGAWSRWAAVGARLSGTQPTSPTATTTKPKIRRIRGMSGGTTPQDASTTPAPVQAGSRPPGASTVTQTGAAVGQAQLAGRPRSDLGQDDEPITAADANTSQTPGAACPWPRTAILTCALLGRAWGPAAEAAHIGEGRRHDPRTRCPCRLGKQRHRGARTVKLTTW